MNALIEKVEKFVGDWEFHESRHEFREELLELLAQIFDEIESRAEANILMLEQREGMHYAALREVRKELGIERMLSTKPVQLGKFDCSEFKTSGKQ